MKLSALLNDLILQGLRQHDAAYFGDPLIPRRRQARDLAMSVVERVASETCEALPDASTATVLWKTRSALAPLAGTLRSAMNHLFERGANLQRDGQTVEATVLELVTKQLQGNGAGDLPPVLRQLVADAMVQAVAEHPHGFDVELLGQAVRVTLANAGLSLQRASACLWTMAMAMEKASGAMTRSTLNVLVKKAPETAATPADGEALRRALKEFADKIHLLNVDPATLPVGEEAVDEARALCIVRAYVQRRHWELRRWVHPQAGVDPLWTDQAEFGADWGERMILDHNPAPESADATDPLAWTWQGQEYSSDVLAGPLACLRHAADAMDVDWADVEALGESLYMDDREQDRVAMT